MFLIVVTVVAVLADSFLASLLIGQAQPALVLLLALAVGMIRRPGQGALVAFLGGLLLDTLAGPPLGRHSLALVLATTPVLLPYAHAARRTVLAPALAAAVGTLVYWLALGVADLLSGLEVAWPALLLRWGLPSLLLNAALAWPVSRLVDRLATRRRLRLTAR